MILSLFVRLDGAAWGYVLTPEGVEPERHHARNLYETPGDGTTTADAVRACLIDQTRRPM